MRDATEADIPVLVELAQTMHAESDYASYLGFDQKKVEQSLRNTLASPDGLLLIAERDGEVIGGMWAFAGEHFFSRDRISADMGLFVRPEYRGGLTAPRLIKRYIEWAKSRGVRAIRLGISTGVHVEETGRLYEKLGFERDGLNYRLREV